MIINHNIAAMNTNRLLAINDKNTSSSLAKLSSGLKVNSAADDAAGLAISEKMKAQVRGLDQASDNAENAISLVQTAEGGLNETQSILQRIRELAVKSSNDTSTNDDREQIQKEVNQLTAELDDISNNTQFNTKNLLDGSVGNTAEVSDATDALKLGSLTVTNDALEAGSYTLSGKHGTLAATITSNDVNNTGLTSGDIQVSASTTIAGLELGNYTLKVSAVGSQEGSHAVNISLVDSKGDTVAQAANVAVNASGKLSSASATLLTGTVDSNVKFTLASGASIKAGEMSFNLNATYAKGDFAIKDSSGHSTYSSASGTKITTSDFEAGGIGFTMTVDTVLASGTAHIKTTNNALTMHVGANQGQTMKIAVDQMNTIKLGISNIDLSTQAGAEVAITKVNDAITKVSTERARLGAYQNRLDHTIKNLDTSSQNLSSAQATITDVDMASEMTEYTKNSILSQAATAMLAQANQLPQNVLSLLK